MGTRVSGDSDDVFEDTEAVDYDPRLRERYQQRSRGENGYNSGEDNDNPLSDSRRKGRKQSNRGFISDEDTDDEDATHAYAADVLAGEEDEDGSDGGESDGSRSSVEFTFNSGPSTVENKRGIHDRLAERRSHFVKTLLSGDADEGSSVFDDPNYESSIVTDTTKTGTEMSHGTVSSGGTPDYNY